MVFSTAGHHVKTALDEHSGHGLGVFHHLLLVSLELRLQGFLEADRFSGDHVLQRATLGAWEYGGVQLLLDIGVGARQDQAATWTAQGLVGRGGHDVSVRHWVRVDASGDQTGHVGHVDEQVGAHFVSDFTEAWEVEDLRVGRETGHDHFWLVLDGNGLIDYDEVERLAVEHKPKMIVAGFSAYSKTLDFPRFRAIADKVGALLFVDMAHVAGLVAAGLYPNPLPYADVVTTTTHKTLRGPRGGLILAKSNEEIEKKLNSAVFPGAQGGPLMHVIAGKAVCFKEAMEPGFKAYQQQVIDNAQAMASVFIKRGYDVVSGGTDNHLFLVSLIRQGLTGKDADAALGRAHITVNKNAVPNDPQSPFVTSGLRIGTPAVTTRGFKVTQCVELAGWICDILDNLGDADVEANVAKHVSALCADFPVYR